MAGRDGGAQPAGIRLATDLTVAEKKLLRAAARILARHVEPHWAATDAELDAWGNGYGAGLRDQIAQDLANRVDTALDCEWPPVAPIGGGA